MQAEHQKREKPSGTGLEFTYGRIIFWEGVAARRGLGALFFRLRASLVKRVSSSRSTAQDFRQLSAYSANLST